MDMHTQPPPLLLYPCHPFQLMVDNGPEVSKLAAQFRELLEGLGEMGAAVLEAPPPAGGGPWMTAKDMLLTVPPAED